MPERRPRADRAQQFMPFAALKGYYDLIRERERVVDALEARRVVHLTEPRNARSAGGSRKKADSRRKSSCVC